MWRQGRENQAVDIISHPQSHIGINAVIGNTDTSHICFQLVFLLWIIKYIFTSMVHTNFDAVLTAHIKHPLI